MIKSELDNGEKPMDMRKRFGMGEVFMKKKFCLALFVTILMMSLLFGVALAAEESSVSADTSWYSSEEILYIEDEADLLGLALIVNGESEDVPRTDFADQTVVLVNDLDLGQMDWTPIGKANVTINNGTALFQEAASMPFRGVFDGNQRKIENLNIEGSNNGMALFGYLGSGGVIKNLTVSGAVSGTYFTGGVVSVCGGTLEEVENQVVVYGEENYVGGLAAEGYGTFSIVGCTNRGAVSNGSSSRSSGFVAGIMGRADSDAAGVIKECANLATITGYQYVAGIIGGQFGDVDVDACYNSAEINGISFGKAYLGGIAGKSEGGTIRNCYNRGDLYDHHWSAGHIRAVGGIAGCEEGRADGTLAISNCYTTGKIELNTSNMTYGTNWIYEVGNISGGNSTTADYNATISGYKVLKLEAEKLNELKYQYQGVDLLWSEKYECYLTMVPSDVTAGAAAVALELVDGTAPEIVYDGDINGDNHLLIDDVQLVYDLYTVYEAYSHDSGYDLVSVVGRLKADYNGDGVVDVLDVRLIQKSLLGYSE